MLHDLTKEEPRGPERAGGVLAERAGESEQHRLLALVAQPSLADKGTSAEGGPLIGLLLVGSAVA